MSAAAIAERETMLQRRQSRRRYGVRPLHARYDAAQTTEDNRRHWSWADSMSAAQANAPGVRRILRDRSRYEVANNSYARGIVQTLANDTIGTGPRLQLRSPDAAGNRRVEQAFARWAREIDLAGKLRTMRTARAQDGEAFAVLITNTKLSGDVLLDLRLVEAEQVTDQTFDTLGRIDYADGIEFDGAGNPTRYRILDRHPGEGGLLADGDWHDAEQVIHWFRCDRPGQVRGLPDIMPALPLFAQLRRFTLATIAAAETAADFAAVMYSDSPAEADPDDVEAMDAIEIEKRMMLTLPNGWQMSQFRAEHPSTTYGDFKREIITEIARCLSMPYNIAAADSSSYNYASGRLDHQTYYRSIDVEQRHCEQVVLDHILRAWLDEAALIPGLLPDGMIAEWDHEWMWPGREHVDPAKQATSQTTRLKNGTTHRAREYAEQGLDVDVEDERAAAGFGMTVEQYRTILASSLFAQVNVTVDDNDGDDRDTNHVGELEEAFA